MEEYIEREALVKLMVANFRQGSGDGCDYPMYPVVEETIMDAPAADVAPVRHGRWEKFSTSNGIISRVRCSCCAGTQPLTFENMPYCPSCGARMDKEAEHEVSES